MQASDHPRNSSDAPAEQLSMRNPNARAHTHTHKHTPKGQTTLALFSLSSSRGSWSENDTLGQERRKRHQNSTTTPRQTLFALSSSLPSASPRSKGPSASALQDISLTLNFSRSWLPTLALRATRKLRAHIPGGTDLALACAHLRHSLPYITTHLEKGTAPAPSKARAVCVACLKPLGNTSDTVQSAGLGLWLTHQEQRQQHQHAPELARCCWRPAHGGSRPS